MAFSVNSVPSVANTAVGWGPAPPNPLMLHVDREAFFEFRKGQRLIGNQG